MFILQLLSRAFRNRFIELHFNEIPPSELEDILHKRCQLPVQYSKKLVAVMHDLQMLRRESGVFCGKQGFITLRDLFRWGERYEKTPDPPGGLDWLQLLADEGYLLLAGRVRVEGEIKIIQDILQKHLKKKVNPDHLFNLNENTSVATKDILTKVLQSSPSEHFKNVVWTRNMRRLAVLVGKAMQYKEPVLLIGTTGLVFMHIFHLSEMCPSVYFSIAFIWESHKKYLLSFFSKQDILTNMYGIKFTTTRITYRI